MHVPEQQGGNPVQTLPKRTHEPPSPEPPSGGPPSDTGVQTPEMQARPEPGQQLRPVPPHGCDDRAQQVPAPHVPTAQVQVVWLPQPFVKGPQNVPPGHVAGGQKQEFVPWLHCSPPSQPGQIVLPHEVVMVPHCPGAHEHPWHTLLTQFPVAQVPQLGDVEPQPLVIVPHCAAPQLGVGQMH